MVTAGGYLGTCMLRFALNLCEMGLNQDYSVFLRYLKEDRKQSNHEPISRPYLATSHPGPA
jgi:hypothetical protein